VSTFSSVNVTDVSDSSAWSTYSPVLPLSHPLYFLLTHLALLSYQQIVAFRPDIVITEKGVSDLAQHYFLKAGITAFRRLRKTDQNRVARATGEFTC
jgi:hypothetical protein